MKRILNLIIILLVLPASGSDTQYSDDFSSAKIALMEAVSAAWLDGQNNIIYWDHRLEASGETREKSFQAHQSIFQVMDKIRNPPKEYAQAQSKLLEAFGVYINLYILVQGSHEAKKEEYEANIREERRKYDPISAQVSAFDPTPRK